MKLALVLALCAAALVGCIRVPAGTHVLVTDTPQDLCGAYTNCYHAPSRTIVVLPGQSLKLWAHELCHAHQHQVILDEQGREPSLDMHEWLNTSEGLAYGAVVDASGPNGWDAHFAPLIEDFAEACGRYLVGQDVDTGREAFFAERNFK